MAKNPTEKPAENLGVIGRDVLRTLGQPAELQRVQVRHLWEHCYRVNVYARHRLRFRKVIHSYFVTVDDAGACQFHATGGAGLLAAECGGGCRENAAAGRRPAIIGGLVAVRDQHRTPLFAPLAKEGTMTAVLMEQSAPKRATLSPITIVFHAWELAPFCWSMSALAIFLTGSGTWGDWLGLAADRLRARLVSTIGYHRFFSHRCFKTSRVTQFILAVLCCTNLQQGPLWWAAYHRHHHRHSDSPSDVHSPHHGGF